MPYHQMYPLVVRRCGDYSRVPQRLVRIDVAAEDLEGYDEGLILQYARDAVNAADTTDASVRPSVHIHSEERLAVVSC